MHKKYVKNLLSYFRSSSIRKKLLLGTGLIVGVMIVLMIVNASSLLVIKNNLNHIVKENQHAVITSIKLAENINKANSSMGYYLLSKDKKHKTEYEKTLIIINDQVSDLQKLESVKEDKKTKEIVTQIKIDIEKFQNYKIKMFELATNNTKNIPGFAYAKNIYSQ